MINKLNRGTKQCKISNNNNNLLLGGSITKSGLHRGPNTRYILYNDTIKIYKLELKPNI